MLKRIKEDGGYLVMESAFVYPIMFFIIFMLIFMGNMWYLKARVDSLVSMEAMKCAAGFGDPLLEKVKKDGVPTGVKEKALTQNLYRYINVLDDGQAYGVQVDELKKKITDTGYFQGMFPSNIRIIHETNNYVVYQTYTVDVLYEMGLPMRMVFTDQKLSVTLRSREETAVVDAPEFLRNMDMGIDFLQRNKGARNLGEKYTEVFGKVQEWLNG